MRWNSPIQERVAEVVNLLGIADAYQEPERGRVFAQAQVVAHALRQLIGNTELRRLAVRADRRIQKGLPIQGGKPITVQG